MRANKTVLAIVVLGMLVLCTGCGSKFKKIEAEYEFVPLDGPAESSITVEAVPSISDGFIYGMDASSVAAEEASGVKYYGFDGAEQDVFRTLAEGGVNCIRLRVWNDPFDENGNGYGGGNNDLKKALALGARATRYGMKVCVDFHYSDFWADPNKQYVPKAWKGMELEEKSEALYKYTLDSLTELLEAGVDVSMVQVGNEINNGMCGEADQDKVIVLLKAGSRAVREVSKKYDKQIDVVIHYTRITKPAGVYKLIDRLAENELDYDVIGLSYYPFWDGGLINMGNVVTKIRETYGKRVVLAETSYPYTTENGDVAGNSYDGVIGINSPYVATIQGQTNMIRDVIARAAECGAEGIFYWEGTWIPVGTNYDSNSKLWEKFGSGWASSYAGSYDPVDAASNYGGCSWDNQAMFDFKGHPLESLKVFSYIKYGTLPR